MVWIMSGSTGWDRTNDQEINSLLHYRCATVELIGALGPNRTDYLRVTNPAHRQQCFKSVLLVEDVGVEPTDRLSPVY